MRDIPSARLYNFYGYTMNEDLQNNVKNIAVIVALIETRVTAGQKLDHGKGKTLAEIHSEVLLHTNIPSLPTRHSKSFSLNNARTFT